MLKNKTTNDVDDVIDGLKLRLDETDKKIILGLVDGKSNTQISQELKIPLSTIQRRSGRLFDKGILKGRIEPDYSRLGLRKGVVQLYTNGVDSFKICKQAAEIPGIISVSIPIGNSDIVGNVIYRDSNEVLGTIAKCKSIEGVTRVVWSEEVSKSVQNISGDKIASCFKTIK